MKRGVAVLVASIASATAPIEVHGAPDAQPSIPAPTEVSAAESLELGLSAYARGDYDAAVAHFERSYALQPDPATLYAWAQASRGAGDCAAAIELYQRFLGGGATGDPRAAAIANQQRCRETLAATPPPDEPPAPRVVEPTSTPPPIPTPTTPAPDRAAIGLLGSGGALLVVGLALTIAAAVVRQAQRRTRDYDRFDALDRPIDGLFIGGGVSLGVGAVLATIGGARLGRRRRAR